MFSRFFRVKKIVVAAGRLGDKEGGGEKTFPEQEKLSNANGDENFTNIIIIHISFFSF